MIGDEKMAIGRKKSKVCMNESSPKICPKSSLNRLLEKSESFFENHRASLDFLHSFSAKTL
ncbi:hypothetical protein LINPERHAP1_LOCUS10463, partial [Linum perenne]